MNPESNVKPSTEKILIKVCHCCNHVMESFQEPEKCPKCKKSFLPSNYFGKVHAQNTTEYRTLFSSSEQLHEDDLIKGLQVLW
jgi:RNA polymerase subunit RPABC4/transcription elongation factor Spt4